MSLNPTQWVLEHGNPNAIPELWELHNSRKALRSGQPMSEHLRQIYAKFSGVPRENLQQALATYKPFQAMDDSQLIALAPYMLALGKSGTERYRDPVIQFSRPWTQFSVHLDEPVIPTRLSGVVARSVDLNGYHDQNLKSLPISTTTKMLVPESVRSAFALIQVPDLPEGSPEPYYELVFEYPDPVALRPPVSVPDNIFDPVTPYGEVEGVDLRPLDADLFLNFATNARQNSSQLLVGGKRRNKIYVAMPPDYHGPGSRPRQSLP